METLVAPGMELSVTRRDDAVFFSQEFEQQVNTRLDQAEAILDFDVGGGFSLVLGGTFRAIRYLDEPGDFIDLSSRRPRRAVLSPSRRHSVCPGDSSSVSGPSTRKRNSIRV